MNDLTQPLPEDAIVSLLAQIIGSQADTWDTTPLFGLIHPPPLDMAAKIAEREGVELSEVRGLLAAPMPLPAEAWGEFQSPMVVLGAFADTLASPSANGTLLVRQLRETTTPVGAWMTAEAWAPPENPTQEYPPGTAVADMVGAKECRMGWAVDAWGRDYAVRLMRGSDELECQVTERGDRELAEVHEALVHLRTMLEAVSSPIPS